MDIGFNKPLVVGGLAVCAIGTVWWWYRSRRQTRKMIPVGKLSSVYIYPVKSCRGIPLAGGRCTETGLRSGPLKDRNWMVVNADNVFTTIRQEPRMALIQPSLSEDEKYLQLDAPNMPTLKVPLNVSELPHSEQEVIKSRVWRLDIDGKYCGEVAEVWLSTFLNKPNFKLIYLDNLSPKVLTEDPLLGKLGSHGDVLAYQDSTPFMVIGESSLQDLNLKLDTPVTMQNFRPNFVISGTKAYDEDDWKYLKIGARGVSLRRIKFCHRCTVTKVDPETGIMHDSEPLKTLRTYRLCPEDHPNKSIYKDSPLFGANFGVDVMGTVRVGDTVYATSEK
ncbi:mitochondrial amidoxime reducing component 2-like [Glandiceps talaboti]